MEYEQDKKAVCHRLFYLPFTAFYLPFEAAVVSSNSALSVDNVYPNAEAAARAVC